MCRDLLRLASQARLRLGQPDAFGAGAFQRIRFIANPTAQLTNGSLALLVFLAARWAQGGRREGRVKLNFKVLGRAIFTFL